MMPSRYPKTDPNYGELHSGTGELHVTSLFLGILQF